MSVVAIKIQNLTKEYRLGVISHRTLYRDVQSQLSRLLGREDPNSIIGSKVARVRGERFTALDDISFEVEKGEVVGIVGKNGAGKSTLLKVLSRVTGPTKGEVKIMGRMASLLEVGTGFHPELTGRENVFLNGAILGMRKKEIGQKFDEIVDFSGVEKYIDTPVKRYSSGMYVRLAFAVAAHLEPDILVVDEVLAVGDAEFQKKCLGKMKSAASLEGRTVLFVSHNMAAITSLCSKGVYLKNGKIAGISDPTTIVRQYLSDGIEQSTFKRWTSESAPGDSTVRLHEAKIVDAAGGAVEFINLDQSFGVDFTYELLEDVAEPIPQIHVYTQKEENAFISYGNMDIRDMDHNAMAVKGMYRSTVWFPANLFNAGVYNLAIGFVDYSNIKLHLYEENAVSFEMIEDLNSRKMKYRGTLGGIVRPQLQWSTKRIDQ